MALRVCLIVDNPLRDLDGLVLLAWHLAKQGMQTFLTPMYNQAFDIYAISPDIVLANYARVNNIKLLRRFNRAGIRVGVLDTEGAPVMGADRFAQNIKRLDIEGFISLYCLWGKEQYDSFIHHGVADKQVLSATGCPRYDFCVKPWRSALPESKYPDSYILVNTRFPSVNPRFTRGPEEELKAMIDYGYEKEYAERILQDTRVAYKEMLGSIKLLAKRFSNYQIVIRPHPFESLNAYRELAKLENVDVRQEGTSIEWINHAKVLIHQNCLTSIEAVMMGCEPVSLEWFNSPAISEESSRKTSYQANSQVELETFVGELLVGRTPQLSSEQIEIREEIIKKRYLAHDGQSAKRVFEAVRKAMKGSVGSTKKNLAHILVEADVKCLARILLGYKGFHYVRRKIIRDKHDYRRKAKLFSLDQVQGILQKLSEVSEEDHAVSAVYVGDDDMLRPRLGSGQTIKVEMV